MNGERKKIALSDYFFCLYNCKMPYKQSTVSHISRAFFRGFRGGDELFWEQKKWRYKWRLPAVYRKGMKRTDSKI